MSFVPCLVSPRKYSNGEIMLYQTVRVHQYGLFRKNVPKTLREMPFYLVSCSKIIWALSYPCNCIPMICTKIQFNKATLIVKVYPNYIQQPHIQHLDSPRLLILISFKLFIWPPHATMIDSLRPLGIMVEDLDLDTAECKGSDNEFKLLSHSVMDN